MRAVFGLVLGVAGATFLLELALWLLPVQDGIFSADSDVAWPVHHLVKNSELTFSSTWSLQDVVRGRTNNFGYVAPFDYERGQKAVVVLGDSYVESMMNPYEETLQAVLGRALGPDVAALNFGISGASLPDYTGIASLVRRSFDPVWVVVLVTEGDYVQGFSPQPGHFLWSERPAGDSRLVADAQRSALTKTVRRLALVRYTRGNLRLTSAGLFHSRPSTHVAACVPETLSADDRDRIRSYVRALPRDYGISAQHVVIIVDSETKRHSLYDSRSVAPECPSRDAEALAMLAAEAERTGINVVDTGPIFEQHYRATGVRVDHSPADFHWNGVGHKLAAEGVLRAMCAAASDASACRALPHTQHGTSCGRAQSSPSDVSYTHAGSCTGRLHP